MKQSFGKVINSTSFYLDLKKLDENQSLKFMNKLFKTNPSDIAATFIMVFGLFLFLLEGFKLLRIIGCFLIPMIMLVTQIAQIIGKNSQSNKKKKENASIKGNQQLLQKKTNQLVLEQKQKLDKTSSTVITNQSESETQSLLKKINEQNDFKENQTLTSIYQKYIMYFIVLLLLEVIQPLVFHIIWIFNGLLFTFFSEIIGLIFSQITFFDFGLNLIGKSFIILFGVTSLPQFQWLVSLQINVIKVLGALYLLRGNKKILNQIKQLAFFRQKEKKDN